MNTFITNEAEVREMISKRLQHLPPLGYATDLRGRCFRLDEEVAPLIQLAWSLIMKGTPVDRILEILNNEKGFRTPTRGLLGGKPLRRSALYKIFADPFYAGYIRAGERCCTGVHEPLVNVKDFLQVQHLLAKRRRNWGAEEPEAEAA